MQYVSVCSNKKRYIYIYIYIYILFEYVTQPNEYAIGKCMLEQPMKWLVFYV